MNQFSITRRRLVGGSLLAVGTAGLPACGGSDGEGGTTAETGNADGRAYAAAANKAKVDTAPSTVTNNAIAGNNVTSLKLQATATGVFPYAATVLPLPGQVPTGYTLRSSADVTLRSTVLSRWPDGSAAVVVVAGSATLTSDLTATIPLQLATASPGAMRSTRNDVPLTAARIAQVVNSVRVDFGSALGAASITNLSNPERIWWASPQTICARYRAGVAGHPTLEAVVDIHAFATSSRALVEVVVENCKFAAATATTASLPGSASYAATVSVNGTQVTSVTSSNSPEGTHAGLRAWYASYWVGGDPGLRVTQLHTDLQQHPLLWKMARGSTADLSVYAGDTYVPWRAGRQRGTNMGGTGDSPSIGPLTQWDAHFLQTGDPRCARASEANALAVLGFNVNYRDSVSGLVPDAAVLKGKSQTGFGKNWPVWAPGGGSGAMEWEIAHHPAAGLMAFICRPSPVYIEIAQKIAVWNATWGGSNGALTGYPGGLAAWPDTDYTGIFGAAYQIRGRAWSIRSLNHATFLSPDDSAWRAGGRYWLNRTRLYLSAWQTHSRAVLNCMWEDGPNAPEDKQPTTPGFQSPLWEYHWLICELHRSASCRFLAGAEQTALTSLADWCALQPVRWVNEQPDGGWRYLSYMTTIGADLGINSQPTWGAQMATVRTGTVSPTGPWMSNNPANVEVLDYQQPGLAVDTNPVGYPMQFWAALVAAVERQVPGCNTAWATVQAGITTPNWQDRFGADGRWGSIPKALPPVTDFASGPAGTYVNGVLTPARDANGLITAASWALPPVGEMFEVAGTKITQLLTDFPASFTSFTDRGNQGWAAAVNSWNGMATDTRSGNERLFLAACGGHAASSNNGVYQFDLRRMKWTVLKAPTPASLYPPGYVNLSSYSFSPDAYNLYLANRTGGNYYDELPDGTPTSRHQYETQVYVPDLGAQGSIIFACRRVWKYDIAAGTWAKFGMNGAADPGTTDMGQDGIGYWNPNTRRYVHSGSQDNQIRNFWYHPETTTFGTTGEQFLGGNNLTIFSSADAVGDTVWHLVYDSQNNKLGTPNRMVKWSMTGAPAVNYPITLGPTFAGRTPMPNATSWSDSGVTWVPPLNKFLCVVNTVELGERLAWIDADTWVCDMTSFPGQPAGSDGIYTTNNRIKYFDSLKAIVWLPANNSGAPNAVCNLRVVKVA